MCEDQPEDGYITIDLSDDEKKELILIYINDYFRPVTHRLVGDLIKEEANIKDILYNAVLNEMTNILLENIIRDNPLPKED